MLPKALGNLLTSLEVFHASSCGIKGMIPSEIGNMSNLIWLEMGGNNWIRTIPDTFSQLRKLQKLSLSENKLQGSIPDTLCNLENMFFIDFGINKLSQQLPTCLGNLTSLREFYLDSNLLTSTIPSTLWISKEIQIVDMSYNFLNGSLDPEMGNIKSMRELYLSRNQFSGEIPSTIGQLQNLVNLTLSKNLLHSPILESLGNLITLQYMDISKNNLYGEIPRSLEKLKDLMYFNVSFNEREIPNGGPFKNLSADFFKGNRELCGASQYKVMPCKGIHFFQAQSTFPITVKRISYYEVLNATNKFDEESMIGIGSIGSIYKGIFSDGMIVAIKVFNLDLKSANKSFDTEYHILCNIRHKNLLKVISNCSNLDLKALVLEYMPNGNLNKSALL
ncbi:putative LRR receptor-like serine/threonine-protein kinase [Abeliophyllum distichum]|uniref:LRR receptor-like serine/threonine-protein kinase n=1 Tax=Abeliophyllum distichum TaxID=126358 RepID=A0ABD1Q6H1_9LAMI